MSNHRDVVHLFALAVVHGRYAVPRALMAHGTRDAPLELRGRIALRVRQFGSGHSRAGPVALVSASQNAANAGHSLRQAARPGCRYPQRYRRPTGGPWGAFPAPGCRNGGDRPGRQQRAALGCVGRMRPAVIRRAFGPGVTQERGRNGRLRGHRKRRPWPPPSRRLRPSGDPDNPTGRPRRSDF